MPWIELHGNLRMHPKLLHLAALVGMADGDLAVGKLSRLWLWCLEYAPDGDLSKFSALQIAAASGVDVAQADKWQAALVEARWLDSAPYLRVHDWWSYAGRFLRKKWERQEPRWRAVAEAYGVASDPAAEPARAACAPAAEPQRIRNGPAACVNQPLPVPDKAVNRLTANRSNRAPRSKEVEEAFMLETIRLFGQGEVEENGGLWRTFYRQNPGKMERVLAEVRRSQRENPQEIRTTPAQFAMDLWKSWK